MTFRLALVTGASSGIGEALCRLLASKGINLLVTGRNHEQLEALALELRSQVKVTVYAFDLSLPEERRQLIEKVHFHLPDLIVNNAGFGLYGEALSYETKEQVEILEVNCKALLEITLEAAKALVSVGQTGVILNVSSSAAFMPFPEFAVYAASKAFVNEFSQALDEELKEHGIRVLAACPGMVVTKFRYRASGKEAPEHPRREPTYRLMTASFAAEQIWKQIEKRKPLYIFNWFYRVSVFLVRYCLPQSVVAHFLKKEIRRINSKPRT